MNEENSLIISNPEYEFYLSNILKQIEEHHKKISEIKTPKGVVKEKLGFDYVELGYMKGIADKEFPGWSWIIIKYEPLGDQAFIVHGRLRWYDNGIIRTGDMVAAHRIQKLTKDPSKYSDLGNDIKSANTDCLKKAFNTYMNICDDVYKKAFPLISTAKGEKLLELASEISQEQYDKIEALIEDGKIDNTNYVASLKKLKDLMKEKEESAEASDAKPEQTV